MANPRHVELVRKGAAAIAEWRQAQPNERLDLSGADFSRADSTTTDLWEATLMEGELRGVDLHGAGLSGALLDRANLSGTMLGWADLTDADLRGANLSGADLWEADLRGANLNHSILNGAGLHGANLSYSRLGDTCLSELSFTRVIGLPTVIHDRRSSVSVGTLIDSLRWAGGRFTPEITTFFRGAGVPKELLDALPAIVAEVKYYGCFISYGQPDVEFAKELCGNLEASGVPCWMYELDKTPGRRTRREVGDARMGADKFVLLCSAATLIRDGVLEEIEDQINDNPDELIPVSLDDIWSQSGFPVVRGTHNLKPFLLDKNYADFANKPYEDALEELLRGLRRPKAKKPSRSKKSS